MRAVQLELCCFLAYLENSMQLPFRDAHAFGMSGPLPLV